MAERVILEIKPGVGGKEAALFAKDLLKMYLGFAKRKGWKVEVLNLEEESLGGLKEGTVRIVGEGVFEDLQFESGVHRVQRIPKTEKSHRIHTSTAKVFVFKEIPRSEIKIHPSELKIETMKASGAGGQYVNKRETAIKITHLPTGIFVKCQSERSLAQNRELALSILASKLEKLKKEKEFQELKSQMTEKLGAGERAEKIRTYNFPQDRVTDHRINKTFREIDEIMEGKLEKIIFALKEHFSRPAPKP